MSPDSFQRDLQLTDYRRDVYPIEITARHAIRSGSDLMIGYLYSRTHSNEIFDYSVDDLVISNQSAGPLPWDTPHRIVSRGAFQTSIWKLLLNYFAEYHTGFPFSAVNSRYVVVGVPNGFRYPAYFALNVGAEKRVPFFGKQWAVRFLTFAGGQSRAFTARLRFVGRK